MTALLLVVVLIALEHHSPVQSALMVPPSPRPADGTNEPSPPDIPKTFTFYDTLPQLKKQDPGFVGLSSEQRRPASSGPATPAVPAVASPKARQTRYTVQVATLKERSAAEALVTRLKERGYPVFILPHVVPKRGTWYRVRVGHFTERGKAQDLVQRLSRRESLTPYIALE